MSQDHFLQLNYDNSKIYHKVSYLKFGNLRQTCDLNNIILREIIRRFCN